tara:strand:- start:335 stop:586 length:252 start_codon:yes stop_codon:yes gene_type:complete
MTSEYWVFAIVTFLFVLSVKKYFDLQSLRESIEEYIAEIAFKLHGVEIQEEEDIVELEELTDFIQDFVIRNNKLFSRLELKDE